MRRHGQTATGASQIGDTSCLHFSGQSPWRSAIGNLGKPALLLALAPSVQLFAKLGRVVMAVDDHLVHDLGAELMNERAHRRLEPIYELHRGNRMRLAPVSEALRRILRAVVASLRHRPRSPY